MKMNRKVSIIVPVYNVEDYINRCVKSLLQQDYPNFEVILVNDGSTDSSTACCHKWALEDERVQVIDKENGGLSDARNVGIEAAMGEFLLFVDSDDYIKEGMISAMMKKISEENAEVCVCDMEYEYDSGRKEYSSGGDFEKGSIQENPQLIRINNSACNKLFSKSLFNSIHFPVGKVYEDLATIPKVLFLAKKIIKVNEPFYVYYQREGSIAHTASSKVFDVYDAIASCITFMEENHADQKVIDEIHSLYIVHGLDLTTLRIKDFSDTSLIESYLKENMKYLRRYYPEYRSDKQLKEMSWKKKVIFKLMDQGWMGIVKKIYGK